MKKYLVLHLIEDLIILQVEIGNFTLGHNRLSIVDHNDLSNQPMTSECGRYTIVFNGEVYNHADIRKIKR